MRVDPINITTRWGYGVINQLRRASSTVPVDDRDDHLIDVMAVDLARHCRDVARVDALGLLESMQHFWRLPPHDLAAAQRAYEAVVAGRGDVDVLPAKELRPVPGPVSTLDHVWVEDGATQVAMNVEQGQVQRLGRQTVDVRQRLITWRCSVCGARGATPPGSPPLATGCKGQPLTSAPRATKALVKCAPNGHRGRRWPRKAR